MDEEIVMLNAWQERLDHSDKHLLNESMDFAKDHFRILLEEDFVAWNDEPEF